MGSGQDELDYLRPRFPTGKYEMLLLGWGESLPQVEKFTYVVVLITSDCRMEQEIE